MSLVEKNIDILQERIDYLTQKIDETPPERTGYMITERSALQYAMRCINDEQTSLNEARAFKKGQAVILKNYKKILKKAVKTGNVTALQFLLDRTDSWLEQAESKEL
ncbi:hypothetical protein BH10PAT3_BH10PAT3_0860 [soil metagenome]